jgi:tetratricopeptide (TPR) repeat protein
VWVLRALAVDLTRAHHFDRALSVVVSMDRAGDQNLVLGALAPVIAQALEPAWERLTAALEATPLPASVQRELAQALAREGAFHQALTVARSIQDSQQSDWAVQSVVDIVTDAGEWARALAITETIAANSPKRYALNHIIALLLRSRNDLGLQQVGSVVKTMSAGLERDDVMVNLARALLDIGQTDRAIRAIEEDLLKSSQTGFDGLDQTWVLNLTQAFAEVGAFEQAQAVVSDIHDDAKVVAMSHVAETMAEAGAFDTILQIDDALLSYHPDKNELLSRAARALCRTRDFERALETADAIGTEWKKADTLRHIAVAMAQARRFQEALAVAESIASSWTKEDAIRDLAQTMVQLGEFSLARTAALALPRFAAKRAEVLAALAQAMARTQDAEGALRVVADIESTYNRALALADTAVTMAAVGDLHDLDRVLPLVNLFESATDRALVLSGVAEALAASGQTQKFRRVVATLELLGKRSRSAGEWRHLTKALAQAGDVAGLHRLLTAAESIRYEDERISALCHLAQAWIQTGLVERAADVAHRALAAAQVSYTKAKALGEVSLVFVQLGALDVALQSVQAIEDQYHRIHALQALAQASMEQGHYEHALVVARTIVAEPDTREALQALTEAFVRAESFNQALALAEAIEDPVKRKIALEPVVKALVDARRFNRAAALSLLSEYDDDRRRALREVARALASRSSEQALAKARALEAEDHRQEALYEVAIVLIQEGTVDAALAVAEELTSRTFYYGSILQYVAQTLASSGDRDRALATASVIPNPKDRCQAIGRIALALAEIGDFAGVDHALGAAQALDHEGYRSQAMACAAQALHQLDQPARALNVLVRACEQARLAGRNCVFEVLNIGTRLLARLDSVHTLWRTYQMAYLPSRAGSGQVVEFYEAERTGLVPQQS